MGLITDLLGARVTWMGLGNASTQPLGYIIVRAQVDGVQGYNEDQISLVVADVSKLAEWIPVILGYPIIRNVINVMKEGDIDALAMPWGNARVTHVLSVCRAAATVVDDETVESANLNGYDEVAIMRNTETIAVFSSHVIPIKAEKAYTGECMTQALQTKDSSLPPGLTIQNAYTELRKCSKNAAVVVRNSMAYPQTLQKKAPVARAVAAIVVLELLPETRVQEGDNGPQIPHIPNLTARQRQGKLFEELDLSRLNSWPLELAEAAH